MVAVRLFVQDVAVAKQFYVEALGLEVAENWGPAIAILKKGDLQFWLSGPNTSAAKPWADGTQPVPGGFTRPVLPLEDWEQQKVRIESLGGKVLNGPISGPGGTQIIIADPDGNHIELFK